MNVENASSTAGYVAVQWTLSQFDAFRKSVQGMHQDIYNLRSKGRFARDLGMHAGRSVYDSRPAAKKIACLRGNDDYEKGCVVEACIHSLTCKRLSNG